MTRTVAAITAALFLSAQEVEAKPSKAWCAQQLTICTKAEAKWLPLAQQYDRECSGMRRSAESRANSGQRIRQRMHPFERLLTHTPAQRPRLRFTLEQ